ncbi:hypothetical protein ACFO1B_31940 [Dactylosporangium siamense]|uniref:SMI1/KNR4 family protein n=1 Tax=Dactylosporangium siamense TaxID=685454 RepID=A0A919UB09_9ACTN|nr:hypothetical protein [Dactylosporangium siamense]GIG48627.1 hypothetical protein Dsi01nite_066680 [Dactylosporangium siamense]
MTIETLITAARVPRTAVEPTPAADLERAFGTRLPADYPHYVAAVPKGYFRGYLEVLRPSFLPFAGEVQWTRDQLRAAGAPAHLLPWARIYPDYYACWDTGTGDPDSWRTGVFDVYAGGTWYPFDGGLTEFLLAFVTGGTGIDALAFAYRDESAPLFSEDPTTPPARVDPAGWSGRVPLDEPLDAAAVLLESCPGEPAEVSDNLPGDYRRLLHAGVAARIRFAQLALDVFDLSTQLHERMLAAMNTRGGLRPPYHPEPDGLIAFATYDNGATACWIPVGADPDRWPVMVVDVTFRTLTEHRLTATGLLAQVWLTEPLSTADAIAAAAAFLASDGSEDVEIEPLPGWEVLEDPPGFVPEPVRVQPEAAFADGRRIIVPYNSIALLDHGDLEAELGGNAPIMVDLDTHECRYIDLGETFAYRERGFHV